MRHGVMRRRIVGGLVLWTRGFVPDDFLKQAFPGEPVPLPKIPSFCVYLRARISLTECDLIFGCNPSLSIGRRRTLRFRFAPPCKLGAPPVGLQGRLLGHLAPQWAAQAASTRARVGRRTMPAPSSGASWLAAPRPHTTAL